LKEEGFDDAMLALALRIYTYDDLYTRDELNAIYNALL